MLRTLIEKEWKSVLLSPKFGLTFGVVAVLILLSTWIGIREYRAFEAQQAAGQRLLAEELPVLLALLAVVLARVPLGGAHCARLGLLRLASALHVTFFMAFGVAVSALTRKPATSFLVLLVSWVLLVLVIPRASLLAAVHLVPVPTVAELESRKEGFETRAWGDYRRGLEQTWRQRQSKMAGMTEVEQDAYEEGRLWRWLEEDEGARKTVEAEIATHAASLEEDLRNRKVEQERLAFGLSRLSPASAYRLVAMRAAGTGVSLKTRNEDAARLYKTELSSFVDRHSEGGDHIVTRRRGGGHGGRFMGARETLDLSEMPRFQAPRLELAAAASSAPLDLGLLAIETLLCFAVGFVAFLRYDVR